MNSAGIDFYELVIGQNKVRLPVVHQEIQEDIRKRLQDCLKYWNIGAARKDFKTIMEEYVPVRLNANIN